MSTYRKQFSNHLVAEALIVTVLVSPGKLDLPTETPPEPRHPAERVAHSSRTLKAATQPSLSWLSPLRPLENSSVTLLWPQIVTKQTLF